MRAIIRVVNCELTITPMPRGAIIRPLKITG